MAALLLLWRRRRQRLAGKPPPVDELQHKQSEEGKASAPSEAHVKGEHDAGFPSNTSSLVHAKHGGEVVSAR